MQLVDLMGAFITIVLKGKQIKLLMEQAGVIFYFLVNIPLEETKANAEFILLSSIVRIATALFIVDDNRNLYLQSYCLTSNRYNYCQCAAGLL